MNTLLLATGTGPSSWDLLTDSAGNIALAREPYAFAQDVASAIKLFLGELWYDGIAGIPYFSEILGHTPPLVVFQEYMVAAALTVPGVVSAQCEITGVEGRKVTGQVTFTDKNGIAGVVTI